MLRNLLYFCDVGFERLPQIGEVGINNRLADRLPMLEVGEKKKKLVIERSGGSSVKKLPARWRCVC